LLPGFCSAKSLRENQDAQDLHVPKQATGPEGANENSARAKLSGGAGTLNN
jgi:hypothetical protein